MGSPHWAQSSGQPGYSAGSLWGWMLSRVRLITTTRRFFQEDEEMLILTHSDELNRIYSDGSRMPFDLTSTSSDDITGTQPALDEQTPTSSRASWWGKPALKETRATIVPSGSGTITVTSTVAPADTHWFDWRRFGRKSYPPARQLGSHTQKQKLWEAEVEKAGGDEGRKGIIPLNPVQNSGGVTERRDPAATITAWEAAWNVTNAIQGIFVLGLPFALVRSGYLGLILMVLSAWVCNHTGRILVACLYEEQEQRGGSVLKVRVRHSYQDIVEASCRGLWPRWPGLGGFLVNLSQVIELLMTCTLYLVVSTSLLSDSLSRAAPPRLMCSLLSLMFLLPCLLLTDLRSVSTLSLLCSLAHVLISLLVMLYCLSQASSWSWSSLTLPVVPEDFLVSVGVIIFSYTSQIFLPPLEGSMEDRGQFNAMLGWTHGTACIMKTTFSLLAVLTWGAGTSEVITKNLPSDLRPLVNMCLLAKALLSFPLPFYSAAEILQSCLLTGEHTFGIRSIT
eukprot:XP_011610550.1 PREDICTED: vesicular inhibitory amino acid transporter-like [Takifugu rubripes]